MKKYSIVLLSVAVSIIMIGSLCMTSCKKNSSASPSNDSAVFLFHFHTQIVDSTIGGIPGPDSNTTGSNNPWYLDSLGRRIELFVPQFFVSNITLANANGSTLPLNNVVVLKGLDSEDYYLCKVPVGTYTSATFTVGLSSANDVLPPTTLFITDGIPYPTQSTMWNGTNYYSMVITGAYDTSAAGAAGGTPVNPIPFSFQIPNSLTAQYRISLPTRGTGAASNYPVYVATAGSIDYIHVLCDYGKLLGSIKNLRTSNMTNGTTNAAIADTLANDIPNMFRYEE